MTDVEKEKKLQAERERVKDLPPLSESPRKKQENLEVESWITKIEKRFARIPKGQPGPQDDQVVVQQPASKQPPVNLPVSQKAVNTGAKASTETGLAWLVSWAIRQIKMMAKVGRKVLLKQVPEVTEEEVKKTAQGETGGGEGQG